MIEIPKQKHPGNSATTEICYTQNLCHNYMWLSLDNIALLNILHTYKISLTNTQKA